MENRDYYVYCLVDPINRIPFYIGKGKGNRMYKHLKGQDLTNERKVRLINTIRNLGHEPYTQVVKENLTEEEAYKMESDFIYFCHHMQNIPLTNRVGVDLKPPSQTGVKWKPESIAKRSATVKHKYATGQLVKIISPEQRKLISASLKGRKVEFKTATCPHCGKRAKENTIYRWHFDNCKYRQD